ncbi:MAG TPA: TetR/AcrR family transcriptional regulator C-terminal ligand-binding domain-containing protein [Galbitalea sp.]|nr:TetR/AcrR family transcriptional regulator C-terminal ligand-binding domain-containing protein [Galbitalea sp.]
MSSNSQQSNPRGRPRSENARRAVLDAAADLALEGAAGAGVDAIAARAGVSRTTVYKWWPSAAAVLLEGLLERTHDTLESSTSATTRESLSEYIARLVTLVRDTPAGALLRGLTAASVSDPSVGRALVNDWLAPRRITVVDLLAKGVQRGEVRDGLDYDSVIDTLFAPIYYRLMYQHLPLTDRLSAEIMAVCWPGIAA